MIRLNRFFGIFTATVAATLLFAALPAHSAAQKRVALVIGNSAYSSNLGALDNPANDATDIAALLEQQGFALVGGQVQLNVDKQQMQNLIYDFGSQLGKDIVGLFYYAGHGIEVDNKNYLVPIGGLAKDKRQVPVKMVAADYVINQFAETSGGLNIMILDACRNTPAIYSNTRSLDSAGLAEMKAPSGLLISYATQPGNVAFDSDGGRNSPYAEALLNAMQEPGQNVLSTFNKVSVKVSEITDNMQIPWTTSVALRGDFYFAGPPETLSTESAPSPHQAEITAWQQATEQDSIEAYTDYVKQFPNGIFAELAGLKIDESTAEKPNPDSLQPASTTRSLDAMMQAARNAKTHADFQQSEQDLLSIISADLPDNTGSEVWYLLGNNRAKQHNPPAAANAYVTGFRRYPNGPFALASILAAAKLYHEHDKSRQACKTLQQAGKQYTDPEIDRRLKSYRCRFG